MPPLLEARSLKTRLSHDRQIELSFVLQPGSVVQIHGPSGAGKTTVLRLLARLQGSKGGEVLLRGDPASALAPYRWRRQVVYLAQQPTMLDGTVLDNLGAGFATVLHGPAPTRWDARAVAMLARLGLEPTQELLQQPARMLSGGEAARVALVRALMLEPSVLLADEPTAALDPQAARALVQLLGQWVEQGAQNGRRGLIFVAHEPGPWAEMPHHMVELPS